jgi:ferredoxin/flavodoxin---NADP+ reductase
VDLLLDAANSHVMLCGNPQMVRDTQQILKDSRGMQKHFKRKPGHMTSEHYW